MASSGLAGYKQEEDALNMHTRQSQYVTAGVTDVIIRGPPHSGRPTPPPAR